MCVCLSAYIVLFLWISLFVVCTVGIVCVFVAEITVDVSCHKCHHVRTCGNDVHVPCNVL